MKYSLNHDLVIMKGLMLRNSSITKEIGKSIKKWREQKHWSQSKLAHLSHCSLATIQNIESGRANPEIGTLERILSSLGHQFSIVPNNIDLTLWPSLGLPIMEQTTIVIKPSKMLLLEQIKNIEPHLSQLKEERLQIAFASFFSALKAHFPSVFSKIDSRVKEWSSKFELQYSRPKLRRHCIEKLATYL